MVKKKVNKTAAIKEALAKSPDGSPKDISAHLSQSGVKVTPAYVSMIKSKMKSGGEKKSKAKGKGKNVLDKTEKEFLKEVIRLAGGDIDLAIRGLRDLAQMFDT